MDACRIARARDAIGGGVLSARIASSAAVFQTVTTSADAVCAAPNVARRIPTPMLLRTSDLLIAALTLETALRRARPVPLLPSRRGGTGERGPSGPRARCGE